MTATITITTVLFLATLYGATVGIPTPRRRAQRRAARADVLLNRPGRCVIEGCTYGGDKLIAMARPDGLVGAVCGRCAEELAATRGWERLASRYARTDA